VLINWNRPADTIECLASILAATNRPSRIVVVDNASRDDSVESISAWARERDVPMRLVADGHMLSADARARGLLLIASRSERGFSSNNNLALRYFRDLTDASHVLLLNSDATVAADFFDELSRVVEEHPHGGLFTGTIYREPVRHRVWYAGGDINPYRALATHREIPPASAEPVETSFVSGCTMLIARPAMVAAGLLDEAFDPAYSEDVDYSLRVRSAGFALIYAPRARSFHKVGGTIGSAFRSPRITFAVTRNRALVVRRNYRGWRRAAGLGYLLVTKPGRALLETVKGRPRIGWAVLTGALSGVFGRVEPEPTR
jgi:GT2 family glycosyltransferase